MIHSITNIKNPKTEVMGVLNLAPNSFSDIGKILDPELAVEYANKLIDEGASIIDVGAEPTNPSLQYPFVSLDEELNRLMPVLTRLTKELKVPISIDTSKPDVMREAIKLGVKIINDVRAFRLDGALETVAKSNVRLCVMHMSYPNGAPDNIQYERFNPNVMSVIQSFLIERIETCRQYGIQKERLIIDPGIGYGNFGKSTQDNLIILKQLAALKNLDCPILVGVSRKTFIGDILNKRPAERLIGSIAAATLAVYNGATIIRTHDVKETMDAIKIAEEVLYAN